MDWRRRSPGSIGERKVATSRTPPAVSVNTERVAVTVKSRWIIAGSATSPAPCSGPGAPMNTYGVPSILAIPVIPVTRPVQNVGQVPGSVSAANQVLKYGDRTANGVAGGRIG